jgi:hypothetical protein
MTVGQGSPTEQLPISPDNVTPAPRAAPAFDLARRRATRPQLLSIQDLDENVLRGVLRVGMQRYNMRSAMLKTQG